MSILGVKIRGMDGFLGVETKDRRMMLGMLNREYIGRGHSRRWNIPDMKDRALKGSRTPSSHTHKYVG